MIRILHVFHELKFSGAEIMYVDAAELFQSNECDLMAVATAEQLGEYAPYFTRAGYSVFHCPNPKKGLFAKIRFYLALRRLICNQKINAVHIHTNGLMFSISFLAWTAKVRSIYTFHNVFSTNFYSYPYHLFKRICAKLLFKVTFQTISLSVYNHERKMYFNNTNLVFNWFGSKRFFPPIGDEKRQFRRELGISDKALVLISIGGCSEIKRHSDIIKAIPEIRKIYPSILYLHLGQGCLEAYELELAKSLNVAENVRFCKNTSEVRKYLVASDIYLMTSKFEGISITTIEAMACQLPCILYDVPGLRDFNADGQNSILIQEDHHKLAESVVNLYGGEDQMKLLAKKGKDFANKNFQLKNNASKILSYYRNIANKSV